MARIRVVWKWHRPVVQANPQTVKASNPFALRSHALNQEIKGYRKKEKDRAKLLETEKKLMRNDWEGSCYWSDELGGFYMPDSVILAVIKDGATTFKKGKDTDRFLYLDEEEIPFIMPPHIPKPESLDAAYVHGEVLESGNGTTFTLEGPCRVPPKTGALIWKCRCMMPRGCSIEFWLNYDENEFALQTLMAAITNAGIRSGAGGWRPKFGRFECEFYDEAGNRLELKYEEALAEAQAKKTTRKKKKGDGEEPKEPELANG